MELSTLMLWVSIILLSVTLHRGLTAALKLSQVHDNLTSRQSPPRLAAGSPAPPFRASVLGTDGVVSNEVLHGKEAVLFFVSPTDVSTRGYESLATSIHGVWHRANGRVWMVCSGDADDCREFLSQHIPAVLERHEIPVLLDPQGDIARRFIVLRRPMAVEIDGEGRIKGTGFRVPPDDPEEVVDPEEQELASLKEVGHG